MESRDAYFDRVYREYAARLKRFLVVRIRSVSDMEDLYQEVWKRFYERTAGIRPQEPFRYLIKIAKGELSKRYKNQSKRNEHEEPLLETIPDAQAPFEPALMDRMDAGAVWQIVKREPLLSYQAFALYYGFDQPVRQVANTLHISEDAVKARLYRTRERIRAEWKGASGAMTERELFRTAVMQYMVDDARIVSVSKARSTRPIMRKFLFAAACILVVVSVSVFSIPSARAAVEEWISGWFSAPDYFGQEKENRTKEPTIEAIITSAGGNTAQVAESGIGFESYAEAFELTLEEIAYDGETIFISGTMSGATARPFLQLHTGGDTFRATKNDGSLGGDPAQEYYFFGYESLFELTTEDGGKYIGFINPHITEDMNPILNAAAAAETEPIFQNSMLITTNAVADKLWDSYLADHNIRFSGELIKVYENMQPMTGIVRGNLSLRLFYGNVEGVESTPVLTRDL